MQFDDTRCIICISCEVRQRGSLHEEFSALAEFESGLPAEISAPPMNKMLVRYNERLHDRNFSPGRVSARAGISARFEFIVNKLFICAWTVLFLSDCFLNATHSLTQVQ